MSVRSMSEQDVFGIEGSVQAGTFRVEAAVAEGGFAVVYRAYHTAFRADVALKCLKVPTMLSGPQQTEFLEQFRGEAELLFRLSARIPAVVRPLHAGTLEGATVPFVPYLAMEWLEGATLEEELERRLAAGHGAFPLDELTALLAPVAEGLHQAHFFPAPDGTITVLHRDLKPANILIALIDGRRTAKILDFGIAKVKSAATAVVGKASMHAETLPAFTPGYAAPEQWAPKRFGQTGPWTDVWGLALTMVEAILGRAPVDGDHAAMLGTVLDPAQRPTPRANGMAVSDAVEAVFQKALAVDPKDRFLTVADYFEALRRASRGSVANVVGAAPALAYARTQELPAPGASPFTAEVPDLALDLPRPNPGKGPRAVAAKPSPARSPRAGPRTFDNELELHSFVNRSDPAPPPRRDVTAPADGGPAANAPGRARKPGHITIDRGVGELAPMSGRSQQNGQRERFRRDIASLAQRTQDAHARALLEREALGTVREKLRLPSQLVIAGIIVAGLAILFETALGQSVPLPFRPLWIAGPLVILGVSLGLYRLVLTTDE